MPGVVVQLESPWGDVWTLITPDSRRSPSQRIRLAEEGLEGLSGRVESTETESVTRYGVRGDGWRIPPVEASLSYVVRTPRGELDVAVRQWRQAWDFEEPCKMHVRSISGGFWCWLWDPVFPDLPSALHRRTTLEESLQVRNRLGHWFGETEYFTGAAAVRARGDRPLSPSLRLRWDGSATSVSFPSGLTVNLPAIGEERIINLDRGMSGQMTRPDGTVDTGGWSSLQGVVHGMSLRPGEESEWVLGPGLTLEVTPRFLSPWR